MLGNTCYGIHDHNSKTKLIKMVNLKWVVIGLRAYAICPRCGAYPLVFRGVDEYHNFLLQCRRCGIIIARKTKLEELQKRAVKRFWGVKNDN